MSDKASSNGHDSSGGSIANLAAPVLTGAIGIAGGIILGRRALGRDRRVLGVPVPAKFDFTGVGEQIGEAGKQLGKLAGEVRSVREKAEQIGRILG